MHLIPTGAPGLVELVCTKVADNLIRAGRLIHSVWAVVPAAQVPELEARVLRWRSHVQAFVCHGDPLKFSQRRMVAAGIVSRQGWEVYKRLLVAAGVLVVYPRSGCAWAYGWDRRKFGALVRRGIVTLPYPTDGSEPPPIFTPRAVAQNTQRSQSAQLSEVTTWAREVEGQGDKGRARRG